MPKLKVFRTAIGFHDAYVAAASRAAALRLWVAETDLFAAGVAELVTDEKLSAAPLAEPGTVIKISRGSTADHMEALSQSAEKTSKAKVPKDAKATADKPVKPRPSRSDLDKAEGELEAAARAHEKALGAIDRRMAKLQSDRDRLDAGFKPKRDELERRRDDANRLYQQALAEWRAAD